MQLRGEDFDGATLLPWLDAHTATVAALAASSGAWPGCGVVCSKGSSRAGSRAGSEGNPACRAPFQLMQQNPQPSQPRLPFLCVPPAVPRHLDRPAQPLPAERRELLSAAADGTLAVTPLDAEDAGGSRQLYSCGGAVSFTAARWNGVQSAATGSLQGEGTVARCIRLPALHPPSRLDARASFGLRSRVRGIDARRHGAATCPGTSLLLCCPACRPVARVGYAAGGAPRAAAGAALSRGSRRGCAAGARPAHHLPGRASSTAPLRGHRRRRRRGGDVGPASGIVGRRIIVAGAAAGAGAGAPGRRLHRRRCGRCRRRRGWRGVRSALRGRQQHRQRRPAAGLLHQRGCHRAAAGRGSSSGGGIWGRWQRRRQPVGGGSGRSPALPRAHSGGACLLPGRPRWPLLPTVLHHRRGGAGVCRQRAVSAAPTCFLLITFNYRIELNTGCCGRLHPLTGMQQSETRMHLASTRGHAVTEGLAMCEHCAFCAALHTVKTPSCVH